MMASPNICDPSSPPAGVEPDGHTTIAAIHELAQGSNTPLELTQKLGAAEDSPVVPDSPQPGLAITVQKRRRVTRACDECRRKKIKCDGKQPCTHCTVYSYECTYDKPSNRRRNPAPQYIEALELRLQKAEALLRAVLPDIDLDDPRFDGCGVEEIISNLKKDKPEPEPSSIKPAPKQPACSEPCDESLLESMVDNTGSLDLDDEGHWDYHGHSSGLIFVRRVRKQIGNFAPERPPSKLNQISSILDGLKSASESPVEAHLSPVHDLPSKEVARKFCTFALEDACCVMRFLHKPSFWKMFDRIYDTPVEQFSNEENTFLPLLYLALAVGCLFRSPGDSTLEKSGYEFAVDQGFQYYKIGRQLLDITECRDLTTLQAICFMILFLQSSANIRTCYSYIGIALRSAVRLGLHRSVTVKFNPIELETRKRVFWVVRKMDVHVSTILGLPSMLSEDDIDQEYPLPVDDEYITEEGVKPMPPNHICLMEGANAHMRLGRIMLKVMKYIYPVKVPTHGVNHTYMVSHSKIREIEGDLQQWMEKLPDAFRPGGEVPPDVERMRQLVRICYAHVQMVMYRPFLHYVTGGSKGLEIDKRSYACAAACVSVARNVVHITAGMKKKQLLNGSYWFTMYTTYFAVLTLLFFILENPDSAAAKDGILKDALEGKNALAGLAKRSMAADRCAQSLGPIFKHLPERLRNRQALSSVQVSRKRSQPASSSKEQPQPAVVSARNDQDSFQPTPPQRANTFPSHRSFESTKQYTHDFPRVIGNTVDDSHSPSPIGLGHSGLKMTQTPLTPLTPSKNMTGIAGLTDGEQFNPSSPSSPLSASQMNVQPRPFGRSNISFSPPLNNPARLPDLMPMMFPSDDPFAYPKQPMSTLEDDHFKQEQGITQDQFLFRNSPSIPSLMDTATHTGSSSPSFGNMSSHQQSLFNTASTHLPSHLKNSSPFSSSATEATSDQQQPQPHQHQQQQQQQHQQNSPGYPFMENPDLVTIPSQSFLWQSLAAQNNTSPYSAPEQVFQTVSDDFSINIGVGMGMDFDMDMKLDSFLDGSRGTSDINNNNSSSSLDLSQDWMQWENWNIPK